MVPPSSGLSFVSFISELMIISTIVGTAVYLIHRHDSPIPEEMRDKGAARVRPWMISTVMLILAFLGPVSLNVYTGGFMAETPVVFSWTWQLTGSSILLFDVVLAMVASLFVFMRPVFAYQLAKYYKGRTTRQRTVIVGVISEFQMTIITGLILLYLLANPITTFVFMIAVPIPILLLVGIIFILFVPVPEKVDSWKELDESQEWWGGESQVRADAVFKDS